MATLSLSRRKQVSATAKKSLWEMERRKIDLLRNPSYQFAGGHNAEATDIYNYRNWPVAED